MDGYSLWMGIRYGLVIIESMRTLVTAPVLPKTVRLLLLLRLLFLLPLIVIETILVAADNLA